MVLPRWTLSEIKEIILAFLSLCWGVLFLFPEDTLGRASRIDLLSIYAGDTTWGIILLVGSCFLLFFPRAKFFRVRQGFHLIFWLFWLGIAILTAIASARNGFNVSDGMFVSTFLTIALLHAAFYFRLAAT